MITLEHVLVSRKTPLDGKLEVSAATAAHVDTLGEQFTISMCGERATATREALACTCAKAAGARHVHQFLVSPLLRKLAAGNTATVQLDPDSCTLHIDTAHQAGAGSR